MYVHVICMCDGTKIHLRKENVVLELELFSKPLPGIPK